MSLTNRKTTDEEEDSGRKEKKGNHMGALAN
ncbi:hypothetical protein CCACVL1_27187 [Corchorus capsularis]|uniref:Uncharacterized protein n=1 Tax=Corchorus capsularis TaxID=210143 RepID=A0A1R3GBX0_COCAP|nr:hypothetical protein CCACVL1_27187 [Corchorus capsularis]